MVQVLGRRPQNNQLLVTMTIDPGPGSPSSSVSRKVRTACQVDTGQRSIPVVVT